MPVTHLLFIALLGVAGAAGADTYEVQGDALIARGTSQNTERWRLATGHRLFQPVRDDQHLYVTGRWGRLLAVSATDGRRIWQLDTGDDWLYPPLVSKEILVVVGRTTGLQALDKRTGRRLWHRQLDSEPIFGPRPAGDGTALLPLFDGTLVRFEPGTGRWLWRRTTGPLLNLTAADDLILAGSYDARLRAFALDDGHLLWSLPLPDRLAGPPRIQGDLARVVTASGSPLLIDLTRGRPLLK